VRARMLALLAVAAPLAGCGGPTAATTATLPAAAPRVVKVVPKDILIRRAERLCRSFVHAGTLNPPVADPADPAGSVRRATAFARSVVVAARRGYRRLHALGVPRRGVARQRWYGFMTQYRATIDHLDEIQAGVRVLDLRYALQSLDQLRRSSRLAVERGRRLGLRDCLR